MMAPFPHRYSVGLTRTAPSQATLDAAPRAPIEGGIPPEFGGDALRWSPEHLLLSSLGLCLFTTFEVFAMKAKLAIASWHSSVHGQLDKTAGGLAFTGFQVAVELVVAPEDVERARELLARASQHCIVKNSLRAPVNVESEVRAIA